MFILGLKKSVLMTYLGVIFGIVSISFAFTKMAFVEVEYMRYSLILLMFAGVCDMFDGKIARMCKRTEEEKELGIQIDSLADTVNFLVVPVIIMLSLGMTSTLSIIVYTLFILCGISRLAVFNCGADKDSPVDFYSGLPVTSSAIVFPILGMLHGQIHEDIFRSVYLASALIMAVLFITRIRVPKFKHIAYYIVIPILAVLLALLLLIIR